MRRSDAISVALAASHFFISQQPPRGNLSEVKTGNNNTCRGGNNDWSRPNGKSDVSDATRAMPGDYSDRRKRVAFVAPVASVNRPSEFCPAKYEI